LDEQIKNKMRRACGTYRGEEKCIQDFGGEICGKETTTVNMVMSTWVP
jgi:hypothetical protein